MSSSITVLASIFRFLSKTRKLQFILLLFFMLFSGVSEAFSLAALIPVISSLQDPSNLFNFPIFGYFLKIFKITTNKDIVVFSAILFASANIISSVLRIFTLWLNTQYAARVGHDISRELYKSILYLPYKEQIKINSSDEIASFTAYINSTIIVVQNTLQVITASVLAVSIFIILVAVNFEISILCLTFFSLSYLLITLSSRKRLLTNSKKASSFEQKIISDIQEGLKSLREITLRSNQDLLLNKFAKTDFELRQVKAENILIGTFPRYLLESVGICSLCFALIFLYLRSYEIKIIIPILGSFALGAQRLLPIMQQIYYGWSSLKSQREAISRVFKKIYFYKSKSLDSTRQKINFKLESEIELKNVWFKYSANGKNVIKNINIKIKKGEKVCFIGKTGGGKSTLIDIIMGLLPPTRGEVLIDGIDINLPKNKKFLNSWRSSIGHVPQNIFLLNSSIKDNISFNFTSKKINRTNLKFASKMASINKFIGSLKYGFDTKVGENGINLSGGQRQRISLARAIYNKPDVLVFDEATSALDKSTEMSVMNNIDEFTKGKTLISISHSMTFIDKFDQLIKIEDGEIL